VAHILKICVVIPAFKVEKKICSVIEKIDSVIDMIYVIDDFCPNQSGKTVEQHCSDERVVVIYHSQNQGVGGAMKTGYERGIKDDMDIFVKIDGDGQMDPTLLPDFLRPIIAGEADYVKGNRFYHLESLEQMPPIRKVGNAILSLINKFTSGYWDIMAPTNGYTAIHRKALKHLPLTNISNRFFFESDMLFRLGTIRAVVKDIPMTAIYAEEVSNLSVSASALRFTPLYIKSFWKRIFYTYFLRDFNVASLEIVVGSLLFLFGFVFGASNWISASSGGEFTSAGTVMLAAVPLILGFQLLLSALHFDIGNVPNQPLQSKR
jgi:dolichol-phosphate mannosyltransferase